mmetsp:Transcript_12197/g.28627  ORF Transcript_12197/g.28627 Transcript_12197/m.28627 type:complete len:101 (+) Transcript_12197:355-657(+)
MGEGPSCIIVSVPVRHSYEILRNNADRKILPISVEAEAGEQQVTDNGARIRMQTTTYLRREEYSYYPNDRKIAVIVLVDLDTINNSERKPLAFFSRRQLL